MSWASKKIFWRYINETDWALEINKKYNNLSENIVGRRFLNENPFSPSHQYPDIKKLHHIFESENIWEGGKGGSWWLKQSVNTEDELKALLDRIDRLDIKKFILPDNWYEEKVRLLALGIKPPLYRHQRGPCTFATSIFGAENTLFLCIDNPELAVRFSQTILRVILVVLEKLFNIFINILFIMIYILTILYF